MKRDDDGANEAGTWGGRKTRGFSPLPSPCGEEDTSGRRQASAARTGLRAHPYVRGVLLVALSSTAALLVAGCQQFTALPALQEGVSDQMTDFQAFNRAFLEWCVDEWKGNPDEIGP